MWCTHARAPQLMCLLLVVTAALQGCSGSASNLSPEELSYIASLNLCPHFRGTCGAECSHYVVHKWRIPLCRNTAWKCCINLQDYQGARVHNETTTIMTTTTATTPTPVTSIVMPIVPTETCGRRERAVRRKRIVGGGVAAQGSWPWLVALRSALGSHVCAGALIAQRWVVTAAHCFKHVTSPSAWRVRVGEHDLLQADVTERDIDVTHIYQYPGFTTRSGDNGTLYARYKHDLALLRLGQDAQVEPLCLPPRGSPPNADPDLQTFQPSQASLTHLETNGQCWVAGWGSTRDAASQDQVLRELQGVVLNSEQCGSLWDTPLEHDMICFGDGTYGPCEGDSGSPLSCQVGGRWYLGGVVSWGSANCTVSGYPSVLTRLTPFLPWLTSTMQRH